MVTLFIPAMLILCGVAFATLAVRLRPGAVSLGPRRMRLRVAALAMVAWVIASLLSLRVRLLESALVDQLISLSLAGIWIWQLGSYARWLRLPSGLQFAINASGILVVGGVTAWQLAAGRSPDVAVLSTEVTSLLGIGLCTFGLFAVEQLHRNCPVEGRSAMAWVGLGTCGVLVVELTLFAETLLLGSEPGPALLFRAAAYIICALAIARGARRMPDWRMGVTVSRKVAFHMGSLALVGVYLLLMSLVGWLLLTFATGWNTEARLAFGAVAAVGLAMALFEHRVARPIKVLITNHFYPHRYDYREEWLRFTRTMSQVDASSSLPQRSIQALAQMVGSRTGWLWRAEYGTQHFQLATQWPNAGTASLHRVTRIAQGDPLPKFLASTGWLVDLHELDETPQLYGGLQVDASAVGLPQDALIVPLMHGEILYGWIALESAKSRRVLNFEDRDLLKIAGRQVAVHLAQYDADRRLAEAHQFETYNRTTAFVMHDLKNIAAQLRLVSQNAERHWRNPEFVQDGFKTVSSASARMTKLVAQLSGTREGGTMRTSDLRDVAERAAARCGDRQPIPQVLTAERIPVFCDPDQLAAVIEHALRNAQDATPDGGSIRVEAHATADGPQLSISDTGCGMDAQFLSERLFRPFDTTKGSRGMGIGAFQIREYMRSLGGDVQVNSSPGAGTVFTLCFARQPATPAVDAIA